MKSSSQKEIDELKERIDVLRAKYNIPFDEVKDLFKKELKRKSL